MRLGLFDSGVGGLTVLERIIDGISGAEVIYVADTLRAPYGTKPVEVLRDYLIEILSFLIGKNVDVVVSACNTLDSVMKLYPIDLPVPYFSVIDSAVSAISGRRVGVLATEATVRMGVYKRELGNRLVVQRSAQILVSAVENGLRSGKILEALLRHTTAPFRRAKVDELILGCTHFPVYTRYFERFLDGVKVVDPARYLVKGLRGSKGGYVVFYVTGDLRDFERKMKTFGLHRKISYTVEKLHVEDLVKGRSSLEESGGDIGTVRGW